MSRKVYRKKRRTCSLCKPHKRVNLPTSRSTGPIRMRTRLLEARARISDRLAEGDQGSTNSMPSSRN